MKTVVVSALTVATLALAPVAHAKNIEDCHYDDGSLCPTVDASGRLCADNRVAVTGWDGRVFCMDHWIFS
jgi:hypothetical protein